MKFETDLAVKQIKVTRNSNPFSEAFEKAIDRQTAKRRDLGRKQSRQGKQYRYQMSEQE